jgi:hypothetical protein
LNLYEHFLLFAFLPVLVLLCSLVLVSWVLVLGSFVVVLVQVRGLDDGPVMRVMRVMGDEATCCWTLNGDIRLDGFPVGMLQVVNDGQEEKASGPGRVVLLRTGPPHRIFGREV